MQRNSILKHVARLHRASTTRLGSRAFSHSASTFFDKRLDEDFSDLADSIKDSSSLQVDDSGDRKVSNFDDMDNFDQHDHQPTMDDDEKYFQRDRQVHKSDPMRDPNHIPTIQDYEQVERFKHLVLGKDEIPVNLLRDHPKWVSGEDRRQEFLSTVNEIKMAEENPGILPLFRFLAFQCNYSPVRNLVELHAAERDAAKNVISWKQNKKGRFNARSKYLPIDANEFEAMFNGYLQEVQMVEKEPSISEGERKQLMDGIHADYDVKRFMTRIADDEKRTVDAVILNHIMNYDNLPNFIEFFDKVRQSSSDSIVQLEEIFLKQNLLKDEISRLQRRILPGAEDAYPQRDEAFLRKLVGEMKVKQESLKEGENAFNEIVEDLVLKMRVLYVAHQQNIPLPQELTVEKIHKEQPEEEIKKDKKKETQFSSFRGHMVSYIDETGRKVMFEVPRSDYVKQFRQKPGRAPEPEDRRKWKGKDYAIETVTNPEIAKIKEHFVYERDHRYTTFPFDLGPHVMEEWKVFERHIRKKTKEVEEPDFSDSLVMRKAAVLNNSVDMTLNRAVQMCEDAWRKRYVPSEKGDKYTKVLGCIADYWKELNSEDPEQERIAKHEQAKARFKQYMYRQMLTHFVQEVMQNKPDSMKFAPPQGRQQDINDAKMIYEAVSKMVKNFSKDSSKEELHSVVTMAGFTEPEWFTQQLTQLRVTLDQLDDIVNLHLPISDMEENEEESKLERMAVCEHHLANLSSLMYLSGARLSDVRIAHDIHQIIKHSKNISESQKREVAELFRFCFREFELFTKPAKTQIFDQF